VQFKVIGGRFLKTENIYLYLAKAPYIFAKATSHRLHASIFFLQKNIDRFGAQRLAGRPSPQCHQLKKEGLILNPKL